MRQVLAILMLSSQAAAVPAEGIKVTTDRTVGTGPP